MKSRRETRADDNDRTRRLLDASDRAFAPEAATELHADFEAIVMEGLLTNQTAPTYPPPGHTYPRKGGAQ